jgi:SAM-dependent methyltransferase
MKKIRPAKTQSRREFLEWYHVATLGQALQENEALYLRQSLPKIYNQRTLQVGRLGSESRYLEPEMAGNFILTDNKGPRSVPTFIQATAGALPFASESIDTIVLPHVLEFVADRHQVLREVERILKPEGKLFILGLNPFSPARYLGFSWWQDSFWKSYLIQDHHLLDWLSILKFDAEIEAVFTAKGTINPRQAHSQITNLKAWFSVGYAIRAIKRNYTLIPIEPEWSAISRLVTGRLLETPQLNRNSK